MAQAPPLQYCQWPPPPPAQGCHFSLPASSDCQHTGFQKCNQPLHCLGPVGYPWRAGNGEKRGSEVLPAAALICMKAAAAATTGAAVVALAAALWPASLRHSWGSICSSLTSQICYWVCNTVLAVAETTWGWEGALFSLPLPPYLWCSWVLLVTWFLESMVCWLSGEAGN